MRELDDFFALMGKVVREGDDGSGLAARLGESRSGRARVARYGELVRRQHVEALENFYPVLVAVLACAHDGLWAALRDAWLALHISPSRHPSGVSLAFAQWLSAPSASSAVAPRSVPLWAPELAELACLQYQVATGMPSPLGVARVASFTHDVIATLRSNATVPRRIVVPRPQPSYVLVFPDTVTLGARNSRLSAIEVAVLAWFAGEVDGPMLEQLGISVPLRDATLTQLRPKLGVARVA